MSALLTSPTQVAEFNMHVTAAGIRPGAHVTGPMLAPETLANRVVLLEFWGLNCPPPHPQHADAGRAAHVTRPPRAGRDRRACPGGLGRRPLDEAQSGKESDPARAADSVQRCAVLFKGSEIGTKAAKLNGEWKKDKQFQATVKSPQQLAKLEQMRDYVREQLGVDADATVTAEQAAAIPAAIKGQIRSLTQGIGKSCPGSSFTDKAATIAAELASTTGSP